MENGKVTGYRLGFQMERLWMFPWQIILWTAGLAKKPIGVNGWETALATDSRDWQDWEALASGFGFISLAVKSQQII